MAGETEKDGGQDTSESTAPAQGPTFTEASGAQRSETGTSAASGSLTEERLVKLLDERLQEAARRAAQSQKDKRFDLLEKLGGTNILDEYDALRKEGLSDREARNELRLRNVELTTAPTVQGRTEQGGTKTETPTFDYAQVLSEAGLDANQPETIALIRGQYRNPDHFRAEALLLRKRLDGKTEPSASAASAMQVGEQPSGKLTPEEAERKAGERTELFRNFSKNKAKIAAIDKELTEAGYPVD